MKDLNKNLLANLLEPSQSRPGELRSSIPTSYSLHNDHNQKISNQLESDYSLAAARNIYDVLDTLDQQDEVDQERDDEDN
jgi:hypothetical protein